MGRSRFVRSIYLFLTSFKPPRRRHERCGFLWSGDASIQPLGSSARNSLICKRGDCGLRASFPERGRREQRPGERGRWPWTGPWAGCRSPQASAGTRTSTRGLAQTGKKKPQPRTVGGFDIGGGPATRAKPRQLSPNFPLGPYAEEKVGVKRTGKEKVLERSQRPSIHSLWRMAIASFRMSLRPSVVV